MGRHREIERTFESERALALPDLRGVDGVTEVTEPVESDLEATYFDTGDLWLAAHGTTLRRRTGGEDSGWHLKLPAGGDERTEVRLPLSAATRSVPPELLAEVRAIVRDRDVGPVAIVRTTRRERRLRDAQGRDLAVLAEDTVHADRLGEVVLLSTWREVEVELVEGDQALLDRLTERLERAGLTRSGTASKLQRALGDRSPLRTAPAPLTATSSAGDVVLAHLRAQVEELVTRDRGARGDEPDAVHKMRVATRRLRSALATYRPLLDRERTDPLRDELRWLGTRLGEVRDAEVLRDRLRALAEELPPELLLGPVLRRVELEMGGRHRAAHDALLVALDDPRYFRLLDALDAVVADPPFTDRAGRRADRVLPALVGRATRRVDRAARAADEAATQEQRDLGLHEVRKAAKRARYAAESVAPVPGKRVGRPAGRLARRMEQLQDTLGEHQDSVVARRVLRELGVQAHLSGENGFTFGLLHGLEQRRGEVAQQDYGPRLRAASAKRVRRWAR